MSSRLVLVAIDSTPLREGICQLVKEKGYDAVEASSHQSALEIIQSQALMGIIVISKWVLPDDKTHLQGIVEEVWEKIPTLTLIRMEGNRQPWIAPPDSDAGTRFFMPPYHEYAFLPVEEDILIMTIDNSHRLTEQRGRSESE